MWVFGMQVMDLLNFPITQNLSPTINGQQGEKNNTFHPFEHCFCLAEELDFS